MHFAKVLRERERRGSEVLFAEGEVGVVDHLLDALLVCLRAYQEHIAGIGHDLVSEAIYDH